MIYLLTGSSGFLGSTIFKLLSSSNQVITLSRKNADINIDLSEKIPKISYVDVAIHAAGKAHSIPKTEAQKQEFYKLNVAGTKNLLKGLEQSSAVPKAFVFISSVAVYGKENGHMISEESDLLATDPYGDSKIQAEKIVQDWCGKNNVLCTILRLPLLAGKNPPGNLGAMIKAIKAGYYFNIAGGKAKKSIVLCTDIAKVIPNVAMVGGIYNLTDGEHPSFYELSGVIANQLRKKRIYNMPFIVAKIIAKLGDFLGDEAPLTSLRLKKITDDLTFDDSKARTLLKWHPDKVLDQPFI